MLINYNTCIKNNLTAIAYYHFFSTFAKIKKY